MAVFIFCFCCDARSIQATFADLTNANVCLKVLVSFDLLQNIFYNFGGVTYTVATVEKMTNDNFSM